MAQIPNVSSFLSKAMNIDFVQDWDCVVPDTVPEENSTTSHLSIGYLEFKYRLAVVRFICLQPPMCVH